MEHHDITVNGVRLHVVQAGPANGPLVILLHGFPEFWYGWRHQIEFLAGLGFRVWVPDQRGYNLSEKPVGIAAYRIDVLAADVVGLIDAAGCERATIIGHDWGAAVGWWVAMTCPERLHRLAALNVPHPAVFRKHLRNNPRQRMKSLYILFFQIPLLPEALLRAHDSRLGVSTLLKSSRSGTFTADDLRIYREAWSRPRALNSMLNWYRALVQRPPVPPKELRVRVPVLLIWGAQDRFLGREMAGESIDLCDSGDLVFIEEATHWVQHEEPDRVNALIGAFLSARD